MAHTPASIIAVLLSGFPAPNGTDPDAQMGAYLISVDGCSIESMFRATKAILQKRMTRNTHDFPPSAPVFAEQCRYQESLMYLERNPRIPPPEPEPSVPVEAWKMNLLSKVMKGDPKAIAKIKKMYPNNPQIASFEAPARQESAE